MDCRVLCRFFTTLTALTALLVPSGAPAQETSGWRPPSADAPDSNGPIADRPADDRVTPATELQPIAGARRPTARVTKGSGVLPNDHGQVWREYDITPYTLRVTSTNQPEQAIVDWILRETGYEAWHGTPLGILSADKRTLRVYHTPEMQAVVADIVDRYVQSEADTHAFGLRIVTVGDPNWRAKAMRLLKPIPVQSQGVEGWLLSKEDAALLLAELKQRTDVREHSSPHLLVNNGQSTVVSAIRPRNYVRGAQPRGDAWPGYEPLTGRIEEGYSLEFSPLLSVDSQTVDAVVKLRLCQVEKMKPVMLEVPTQVAPRQRVQVEVPQMTQVSLHERFRWPVDQVLLLGIGVVATPGPTANNSIAAALSLPTGPPRADALLFIESRDSVGAMPSAVGTPHTAAAPGSFTRRY